MKILYSYIFRQFARSFLFSTLAFLCIFVLVTIVERLDALMDHHVALPDTVHYFLLTLPATILVISPVSTLLSAILVSGKLSTSGELPAIRSAGINMRQLLTPFLAGGFLILGMNLANSWWIAPAAFARTHIFEDRYFFDNNSRQKENQNIHLLEPGNKVVSIGQIDPVNLVLGNVSVEEFSGSRVVSRTDSDVMHYDATKKLWLMKNASTRRFIEGKEEFQFEPLKPAALALSPQSLKELSLQPDEMNIVRHYRYLAEKQTAGFSGLERSMVIFHNKTAMPFASLIIILIGVPLSAKKKRGGLASEISISLFAGFLYLGVQKSVVMIGNQGAMNPMLAAWLPNLLFLGLGYAIYKTAID